MKAIILAAGQGSRLRPYTNDRPKCMVELRGRPLIDHQVDVLRAAGVDEIHVITGYLSNSVVRPGLIKHINPNFASTNMVATLFSASHLFDADEDVVISYGDIVYELSVLQALLDVNAPIVLSVDLDWRKFWEARMENPLADAETLKLVDGNRVVELGRRPKNYDEVMGQYMGLIKVRADYTGRLVDIWNSLDRNATFDGKDVNNMFMTSFLQYIIDRDWEVRASFTRNRWLEIDAPEDLAMDSSDFWMPHVDHH